MSELSILVLVVVGWIVISVGGLRLYPKISKWFWEKKINRYMRRAKIDHSESSDSN